VHWLGLADTVYLDRVVKRATWHDNQLVVRELHVQELAQVLESQTEVLLLGLFVVESFKLLLVVRLFFEWLIDFGLTVLIDAGLASFQSSSFFQSFFRKAFSMPLEFEKLSSMQRVLSLVISASIRDETVL
jgi:hypothetical protein